MSLITTEIIQQKLQNLKTSIEVATGNSTDTLTEAIADTIGSVNFIKYGKIRPYDTDKIEFYDIDITDKNIADIAALDVHSDVTRITTSSTDKGVCQDLTNLKKVKLPEGLKEIGDKTFYGCKNLQDIVIPNSVTNIGNRVLENCSSITSVTIPFTGASREETTKTHFGYLFGANIIDVQRHYVAESVKTVTITDCDTIAKYTFVNCNNIESITIPDSVTVIGAYAFDGCNSLTNFTIPDNVVSIGNNAFNECSSLTSIAIPDKVTNIDSSTFQRCTNLTNVSMGNNVTTIGNYAFYGCSKLTNITIPDSVTTIGSSAFSGCICLTNINIPNGCTSIGWESLPSGLTSVTIPSSVTSLDSGAFSSCSNLTNIIVDEGNTKYKAIDGNVYSKDGTSFIAYAAGKIAEEFIIPDTVDTVGKYAFAPCKNIKSVTLPNSIQNIGDYAFDTNLESITFKGTAAEWRTIEKGSSWKGSNIRKFYIHCTDDILDANGNSLPRTTLNNDNRELAGYTETTTELVIKPIITNNDGVDMVINAIADDTFHSCALTSITIPNTVNTIGNSAFYNCDSLVSIIIPEYVTAIGERAFGDCNSLASITVSEDNTAYKSIDGNLYSKDGKTLILYPIGKADTNVVIPDGVTTIDNYALHSCSAIESLTIPSSVTNIGDYALYDCTNLNNIVFTGTKEQWKDVEFGSEWDHNIAVKVVECNDGKLCMEHTKGELVTVYKPTASGDAYEAYICSVCGSWYNEFITPTEFTITAENRSIIGYTGDADEILGIPLSFKYDDTWYRVVGIDDNAFYNCTNITSVVLPITIKRIGDNAFSGCSNIKTIYYIDGWLQDWNKITFGSNWNQGISDLTINCYDGYISNGTETDTVRADNECYTKPRGKIEYTDDPTTHYDIHAARGSFMVVLPIEMYGQRGAGFTLYETKETYDNPVPGVVIDIGPGLETVGEGSSLLHFVFDEDTYVECTPDPEWFWKNFFGNGYCRLAASNRDQLIYYNSVTKKFEVSERVMLIGDYALQSDNSLTSVELPESVRIIDECAFDNCSNLTEIIIPAQVELIRKGAFSNCTKLTNIIIAENSDYKADGGVIYSKDETTIVAYATNGNGDLSFNIPESVTTIGDGVFYNNSRLTSITIPSSVTTIGANAFENCAELTSITIPSSVTSIGEDAFLGCDKLTDIYIYDLEKWCNIDFANDWANPLRRFNTTSKLYLIKDGTTELVTNVTIPNSITDIKDYAFCDCNSLTSITLHDSINSIGNRAFSGCTELADVALGNSVKSINAYAFNNCYSLTSITIPESVTTIGNSAFSGCDNLTNVTIPESVTSIGSHAFDNCSSLTNVVIKGSIHTINEYTFSNCPNLTCITIPDSVMTISYGAFNNCPNLSDIIFEGTRLRWDIISHEIDKYSNPALQAIHCTDGIICFKTNAGEAVVENVVDATCTANGRYDNVVYCTVCGEELSRETITVDALGHDYEAVVTAPTCTTVGYTIKTCSVCDYFFRTDEVAALGHNYTTTVTAPECAAAGYTTYTCSVCGYNYKADTVPALGHTVVIDEAVAPTCTETGLSEGSHCSVCNRILTGQNVRPALGHIEDTIKAVAATCTTPGKTAGTKCILCKEILKEQEVIPALGHTEVVDEAVAPTCTATGLTEGSHCSVCNEVFVAQTVVNALDHNYDVTTTAPTVNNAGSATYICSVCGHTYTEEMVPVELAINVDNRSKIGYTSAISTLDIPAVFEDNGIWYKVTEIEESAFMSCNNLTSVSIPECVTNISDSAFANCANLTTIAVNEDNTEYQSIDGNLYSKDGTELIIYTLGKPDTSFEIPNTITRIGDYAFYNCSKLTAITFDITMYKWSHYIELGSNWNTGANNFTIEFTDGKLINNVLYEYFDGDGRTYVISAEHLKSLSSYDSPVNLDIWNEALKELPIYLGSVHPCKGEEPDTMSFAQDGTDLVVYFNGDEFCRVADDGTVHDSSAVVQYYWFIGSKNVLLPATLIEWLTYNVLDTYWWHDYSNLHLILPSGRFNHDGDGGAIGCSYTLRTPEYSYLNTHGIALIPCDFTPDGAPTNYVIRFGGYDVYETQNSDYGVEIVFHNDSYIEWIPENEWFIQMFYGHEAADCDRLLMITPTERELIGYTGEANEELVIPESITDEFGNTYRIGDIENDAFTNCDNLNSVTIPENTSIGYNAFADCDKLENVIIGGGWTFIYGSAFEGCTSLTSLTINKPIESIGDDAFKNCTNLSSIIFNGTINEWKSIDKGTDWDAGVGDIKVTCTDGEVNLITDLVINSTNRSLTGYTGAANENLIIPEFVTDNGVRYRIVEISQDTFLLCDNLASVTIPDSVRTIGDEAFSSCSNLTSITIGKGVTHISANALSYCDNLESIQVVIGNTTYYSHDDCLIETASNTIIAGNKFGNVSNNGTSIGELAFSGRNIPFNIYIPRLDYPNNLTTIGAGAFQNCSVADAVIIKDGVINIGNNAFSGCSNLTSITIPNTVTNIGDYAFYLCHNISSIIFNGTAEQWNAISKGTNWISHTSYYIYCSDTAVNPDGTTFDPQLAKPVIHLEDSLIDVKISPDRIYVVRTPSNYIQLSGTYTIDSQKRMFSTGKIASLPAEVFYIRCDSTTSYEYVGKGSGQNYSLYDEYITVRMCDTTQSIFTCTPKKYKIAAVNRNTSLGAPEPNTIQNIMISYVDSATPNQ